MVSRRTDIWIKELFEFLHPQYRLSGPGVVDVLGLHEPQPVLGRHTASMSRWSNISSVITRAHCTTDGGTTGTTNATAGDAYMYRYQVHTVNGCYIAAFYQGKLKS